MPSGLKEAVIELREEDALRIAEEELKGGTDPLEIVAACREAMDVIGQRFADGEAFIPELIMAGEIMQGITAKLKPYLKAEAPGEKLGTVVMCTVQGDIHDIGKDIVVTMLDIAGFDVIDLGRGRAGREGRRDGARQQGRRCWGSAACSPSPSSR